MAVALMLPEVRDIRAGSPALNLCELAAGRLDAFVEQGLKPWDRAAAGLVATEAGLVVRGLDGEPDEHLRDGRPPGDRRGLFRARSRLWILSAARFAPCAQTHDVVWHNRAG